MDLVTQFNLTQSEINYLCTHDGRTFLCKLIVLEKYNPKLINILEVYCKIKPYKVNKNCKFGKISPLMVASCHNPNIIKFLLEYDAIPSENCLEYLNRVITNTQITNIKNINTKN